MSLQNAVNLERINELKQKLEEQEKIIGELSSTPGNEGKQAILASLTDSQKQVNIDVDNRYVWIYVLKFQW